MEVADISKQFLFHRIPVEVMSVASDKVQRFSRGEFNGENGGEVHRINETASSLQKEPVFRIRFQGNVESHVPEFLPHAEPVPFREKLRNGYQLFYLSVGHKITPLRPTGKTVLPAIFSICMAPKVS